MVLAQNGPWFWNNLLWVQAGCLLVAVLAMLMIVVLKSEAVATWFRARLARLIQELRDDSADAELWQLRARVDELERRYDALSRTVRELQTMESSVPEFASEREPTDA